jgi:hypothetical protein
MKACAQRLEDGHGLVRGVEVEGVVEEREGGAMKVQETRRGAMRPCLLSAP